MLSTPGAFAAVFVLITLMVTVTAALRGIFSPCGLSMVSAINPFSERSRGNRYWLTAVWFVVGSVAGGALLGAIGGLAGLLFRPLAGWPTLIAALAALCCLLAAASDAGAFGFRLPTHPRQVNERWLSRYRRWVYAAGFGVQIGIGFATYIMTAAVYLVPVLGALSGSWQFAVLIGVVFGLVRGLAVLISSRASTPAALRRLHQRLDQLEPWSRRAATLMTTVGALGFGALAAGWPGAVAISVAVASVFVLRHAGHRTPSSCPSRVGALDRPTAIRERPSDRIG